MMQQPKNRSPGNSLTPVNFISLTYPYWLSDFMVRVLVVLRT